MPKVNQSPLAQNAKIKIFNIEFPEALRKPLDLLNSNVRGGQDGPKQRLRHPKNCPRHTKSG